MLVPFSRTLPPVTVRAPAAPEMLPDRSSRPLLVSLTVRVWPTLLIAPEKVEVLPLVAKPLIAALPARLSDLPDCSETLSPSPISSTPPVDRETLPWPSTVPPDSASIVPEMVVAPVKVLLEPSTRVPLLAVSARTLPVAFLMVPLMVSVWGVPTVRVPEPWMVPDRVVPWVFAVLIAPPPAPT